MIYRRFVYRTTALLLLLGAFLEVSAQTAELRGTVKDKSGQALVGATIRLTHLQTKALSGATTNESGEYALVNIPAGGPYEVKVNFVGYKSETVTNLTFNNGERKILNFTLSEEAVQARDVIVEVNRARERETPVAFSNVDEQQIMQKLHTQDAPLLIRSIPGVYAYSTDGVGNGESRLFVRGFDQNRVQVLINGVPTNDPESNAVYWSNWGAVSSAAASIQVQRGAGSSLYGAGSFGGSFNIVTQEVRSRAGAEIRYMAGYPELNVIGGSVNSGLWYNTVAATASVDWKTGRGARAGSYYEGANYYFGVALYPDEKSSVKFILHGGPQEHSYSYTAPLAYFKKFGYQANPAYFLPTAVLKQSVGSKTVEDSLRLSGDSRLLRDSKYLSLAHNFYHKPQFEIHFTRDFDENNSLRTTFFYSVGRGGGSAVNSASYLSNAKFGADTTGFFNGTSAYQNLGAKGVIKDDAQNFVVSRFLRNAYQRISYSLHRQFGIIASWDWKVREDLKLTIGGEYRDWFADHPGYFTNLFGKSFLTVQRYAYRVNGVLRSNQFTRRTYQGDMAEFGGSERNDVSYFNPFMSYKMSTQDGTYNAQYRNYEGATKQGTLFAQATYKYDKFNITGSLQYVRYQYHIKENMPSENAIADSAATPVENKEGLSSDGYFYMASYANNSATTPNAWYRFKLVDAVRTRGFWQPKIGVNYNVSDELNIFANYSHVERFADLSVYYNYGNINPNAEDEKSEQIEVGAGYKNDFLSSKINLYYMTWDNKSAQITDVSKAGQPGYDRNGNRYELVGSSRNQGIEFEGTLKLDPFIPLNGFEVSVAVTLMDNKWTKVLDQVKTDATGKRRAFDTGALNAQGQVDTLFFDELEGKVNASTPFTTIAYGISYSNDTWFASLNGITSMDFYAYDGGSYIAVDGYFDNSTALPTFVPKYDNKLPTSTVFDAQAGVRIKYDVLEARIVAQVLNLFDTQYLVSANRSGVLPGLSRSYRLTLTLGL